MTGRKKALGRGLESLLPTLDREPAGADHVSVDIDQIDPNPFQPRADWNTDELETLAASIRTHGILQPLVLRRKGKRYQLIAGERRLRAGKIAGLESVPAVLRAADDRQMLALALVENIHRRDLGPIEKGEAFQRLSREFDLTQEEMGSQFGLSRSAVANFIRLLELPSSVKDLLRSGKLTMGHGRALLGLEDPEAIARLARKAVKRGLNVRQVEEITGASRKPSRKRRKKTGGSTPDEEKLVSRLQRRFKTRVHIHDRGGSGHIEIEYHSLEELDRLLEELLRE
jgi:ParB family chromosome partitioning protein